MDFRALRHQKLFWRILSYFICILSAVLIVGIILYWYFAEQLERTASERLQLNLNSTVQMVDYSLTAVQNANVGLTESPIVRRLLKPDERLTLNDRAQLASISSAITDNLRLTNGMTDNVFLYIDDRRVFLSEGADEFDSFFQKFYCIEGLGSDFWRRMPDAPIPFQFLAPTTVRKANYGVAHVAPIVSVKQVNGASAVSVSMYSLDKMAALVKKGIAYETASCAVLNQRGEVILNGNPNYFTADTLTRTLIGLQANPYTMISYNGKKSIAIQARSEQFGWQYLCVVPFLELGSKTANLVLVLVLSCGVLLGIGSLFSILFAYKIYSPLHNIRKILSDAGDAKQLLDSGDPNELRQLTTGLQSVLRYYSDRMKSITNKYIEDGLRSLLQTGGLPNINTFQSVLFEQLDYHGGELVCAVIDMNYTAAFFKEMQSDGESLSNGVLWIAQMLVSERLKAYTILYAKGMYVVIAVITGKAEHDMLLHQMHLMRDTFKYDMVYCNPAIGVGESVESAARLPHSFGQAMQAAKWATHEGVVEYSAKKQKDDSYIYTENDENKLLNCLSAGDIVRFREVLAQIIEKNELRQLPIGYLELLYDDIFTTGLRFLARNNLDLKDAASEKRCRLARLSEEAFRGDDILQVLMEYYSAIFAFHPIEKKESSGSLILLIKEYIDANFCDPGICLEKISEGIGVSSKYVSRIFKEKSGENLSDYITRLRMHKAKQLLEDSTRTLEDVCGQVGLESRSTFMRLFKKSQGITPGAWRESVSKKRKDQEEDGNGGE